MTDQDVLFELRNYFVLGNYQAAINEGDGINPRNERDRTERDAYVYRSYIAQGNYQIVLDGIKDSAPTTLRAVKLLASYLASPSNKDSVLVTLKQWMSETADATLQLIAGTIHYHEQNYEDAMKCARQANSLEGLALLVQTYLKIDRLDHAEKELKAMQQMDDDSTVTQLTTATVFSYIGGDKFQEAFFIYKELSDKFGITVLLLNGQAVCQMHMKKYEEAERFLLEALEKNSKDADTIANLVSCYTLLKKSNDIISRYLSQLKSSSSNHPWVAATKAAEEAFDRNSVRFAI